MNGDKGAKSPSRHHQRSQGDSRVSGLVQYLKCAAAHFRYLGIEVDDALEIAEQTEV
jgi:hypothetical protein